MILKSLLNSVQKKFEEAHFESADTEAAYLVSEITGIRHNLLALYPDREISPAEFHYAREYLNRRLKHEPFQYICSWTEFRFLKLAVGPGCLIPRPETEQLVELLLRDLTPGASAGELGTGSGAIALSIASERPDTSVAASEISPDALRYARENLESVGLKNVRFFEGDLFQPFPEELRFHFLAANLPYIPESARESLPPNVREYEPETALFAANEGCALIQRALREAPAHLFPQAKLYFEIGSEQGEKLKDFAGSLGFYRKIQLSRDQYGEIRFLLCEFA